MKQGRWKALIVAFVVMILPLCALADVPSAPMEAFFVNDFADVITAEDAAAMLALGEALEDATSAQVVAVTVDFLDGMDSEEYGEKLFNKWGLGTAQDNNGVLLLLSVGDRDIRTTVGLGLESKMSASVTGAYTDSAYDYFAADNYSAGMRANYEALVNKVASIYGVTLQSQATATAGSTSIIGASYDSYDNGYGEPFADGFGWGGIMSIIIGIVLIVVVISVVGSLLRSAGNASGCLFGWLLGRGARPRRRSMWMPPPRMPRGPMGGGAPRTRPPGGRSTGSFGGGGSTRPRTGGGGGASRPRSGGGGGTRGGGSSRKF